MTDPAPAISTRHLVAPELLPGLDIFPTLDFTMGIDAVRGGGLGERPPVPPGLEAVDRREVFVPGLSGGPDVRLLVYTPPGTGAPARAAVLELHGGGYIIGDADMSDIPNRAMALEQDCIVVSVDYRLAPETAWPGALEDCYTALCWMHGKAGTLGLDPARIAVAGGSAGGGHAAALAIHARNAVRETGDGPAICFQLLDFPMLDDRTCAASDPHPYCGEFVWTPEWNRIGWQSLLGMEPGTPQVPEAAVPARVRDLSGLPPAYIMIGTLDLFLEESLEYARRLTRAGVPVELHVVPGGYHGFGLVQDAPQSRQVARLRAEALARALRAPA